MKTIFMTITGGFGIRNIFRSDALKILKSKKDVRIVIFTPFVKNQSPISNLPEVQEKNIVLEDLGRYKPNIVERLFRKMTEIIFFNKNYVGTTKLKDMILLKKSPFRYSLLKLERKILGKNLNTITILEKFDTSLSKYKNKKYKLPFKKYNPSIVFTTDFLHLYEWGFVKTARLCGVPVISMIANWDHFTKGRPHRANKFIVWNEFNKKQLIEYYGYDPDDVLIAGIPHQDYFIKAKNKLLKKKNFMRKIGANENEKLITYTTARRLETDRDIIDIICKAIKNGEIEYPAHLHVRAHPEDNLRRYEDLKKYGKILTFEGAGKTMNQRFWSSKMIMTEHEKPEWCPDEEDMIHYTNLLRCSDVVVNVASSVTLDAAALDIPIINIAFDGYSKKEFVESRARSLMLTHYEFIPRSKGVRIARGPKELIKYLNMYLKNPKLDREGRKKIVKEHCGPQDGRCGERIAHYILEFLKNH